MAAFGATKLLPTIAGSHTDYPARFTHHDFATGAIDGGANSIDNGGGNLRVYEDDTKAVQLSLQVVKFVTGGTPDCEIYVKNLTAETSATVYFEADEVATTQPAVDAAFGSESVWSLATISARLNESSGSTATDSKGNRDGTYAGNLPTVGANFGQDFDGVGDYVNFGNSSLQMASGFTFSAKVNKDQSIVNQIFTSDSQVTASQRYWQWRIDADGKVRMIVWNSSGGIITNSTGTATLSNFTTYLLHFDFDGSNYRTYVDGAVDQTVVSAVTPRELAGTEPAMLGATRVGSPQEEMNGEIGDLVIYSNGACRSADWIATDADNQLATGAWGTVGAWEEQDAGGNTITANQTEAGDTQTAALTVPAQINASQSEAGDAQSADINAIAQISTNQQEDGDTQTASIVGVVQSNITANQSEAGDGQSAALSNIIQISATQNEDGDTQDANLSNVAQVSSNQNEAGDTQLAALTGVLTSSITAVQQEDGDVQSADLSNIIQLFSNQNEGGDTQSASIVGEIIVVISADQLEGGDTQTANLSNVIQLFSNQNEAGDIQKARIGGADGFETALQKAIYATLSDALTYDIYDEAPQGSSFPYITIGEANHAEWDTDTTLGNRVSLVIHSWSRYRGRKEIKEMQGEIYAALNRSDLDIIGYHFVTCDFVNSQSFIDTDGKTRHGTQAFNVLMDSKQ